MVLEQKLSSLIKIRTKSYLRVTPTEGIVTNHRAVVVTDNKFMILLRSGVQSHVDRYLGRQSRPSGTERKIYPRSLRICAPVSDPLHLLYLVKAISSALQ